MEEQIIMKRIGLELPEDLYNQLVEIADKNERSLSAQVRFMLKKSVEEEMIDV